MTAVLKRFLSFILVYFRRREPAPIADITPPTPVEDTPLSAPKVTRPRAPRPKVDMGLKRSILDHLDDNTKIIGRMKAFFPTEYGLYSQIGAVIVPHEDPFLPGRAKLAADPVSPWFLQTRPAFGAVVTGNPHDETRPLGNSLYPRLMHFLKIEHPKERRRHMFRGGHVTVQPIAPTSDFYVFTLYFDERDWARLFSRKSREDWKMCKFYERAFAIELPLEITKENDVRPLKIKRDKYVKADKRSSYSDVRRTIPLWDYPFSKEFVSVGCKSTLSPELYILSEVAFTLWSYEAANASMIQVRASKAGVCSLVNVNVEQTPSFFDDREEVWVDGIKKRIFHIVRPHERQLGDKTALVHLHFRGLRQFVWNGYQIEISVPGRDHLDFREFDVTAINEDDERVGPDLSVVGAWLVANQKARFGAMVGKTGAYIPLRGYGDD